MALSKLAASVNLHLRVSDACDWLSHNKYAVLGGAIPLSAIALGWICYRANKDLPPGPRFFLFSGFFNPKSHEIAERNCLKLREEHGDVVSGRAFQTVIIVLNSYEAVKEAYITHGDCISGRPPSKSPFRIDKGKGIINAEGQIWQEHRRFVLSSLRDFGFGKIGSESIIQDELHQLQSYLEREGERGKKALDPRMPLAKAATNVICSLVFGQRCGTEAEFERITNLLRELQQDKLNKMPLIVLLIVGLLMICRIYVLGIKKLNENIEEMLTYVEGKIEQHRKKHCDGNEADLIDSYLTTQAEHERTAPGKHSFTDPQLSRVIFEVFLAGTDTVASMMRWSLFLMATHPEIQEKVHRELSDTLENRLAKVSDRNLLKYTDAVLHEVHRYAVMLPLGGPLHRVTKEVYVRGFRFPEGAFVATNLFAIFRDPKIWPHPNEFNPQNFFDSATNSLINSDYLIPFLIGRRACPGESLAKQELFLFFSGLLQRFQVKFDPEVAHPTINEMIITGFNRLPPDYNLLFVPRD